MNKYYKILMTFPNDKTTPYRQLLVDRYGEELVEECLKNGYIVQCGTNHYGEPIYRITEKGKKARDN